MDRRRFSLAGSTRLITCFIPFAITAAIVAVMALPISVHSQAPSGEKPPPEIPPPPAGNYVPGEILVKFRPGVARSRARGLLADQGLQVTDAIQSIDVLRVAVKPGRELESIAALRRNPNVLYAEPNYIAYALDTVPNDPYYGSQWGLSKIQAPAAWDITTGGSNVIIAVVDTGIDLDHPDFNLGCPGKLTAGWDFVNNDPTPDDDHSHGSHVAGIAAACTNNGTGVAGVSWGARLMPVKVLRDDGWGSYADVASGITYAVNQGADIVNLSLGGASGSSALANAVQYAHNQGRLVIAATGNTGGAVLYPAAYPEAMAVAATNSSDGISGFSNHGPQTDVAAPGVSIYSTVPPLPSNGYQYYAYKDGTSMATPHVSGLAALIWSFAPNLTHDQVRGVIQSSADDLGDPGKDDYFGYGRINAWRALASTSLETSPDQAGFLIDDDSGPFPASSPIQVTTVSQSAITWTTSISPSASWLSVAPPVSGMVSAASSDSFTLVATRPVAYGTYTTTVVVTGTTASGGIVGPATTQVRISYLADLYEYRLIPIFKNYAP